MVILLLAGLSSLPREPYEAARMDGASPRLCFIHITLPLMRPVIIIALLLRFIFAIKTFDIIYIMTKGGPGVATDLISYFIYRAAFFGLDIGRASGDLPPALRQAAFDAPFEGGTRVGGVSLADGSYGAWILSNVIPGDPGALTAEEREQIRQQLAQASAGADLNGYVGELRQSATVVINREQFE